MLVAMRRVYPLPESENASIDDLYGRRRAAHPDGRPTVELCMITTPDGAISVDGRSGPLGSTADSAVLAVLRQTCDVVVVGAGTVRTESYGAPARAGLRIGVVSRSGNVDTTTPLFTSGSGFLVVPATAPVPTVDHVVCGDDSVDFARLLATLHSDFGASFVHVEGGPQINAELLAIDCVDAVNLTVAPFVSGGEADGISAHTTLRRFMLEHLCVDGAHVFARYARVLRSV